MAFSDATSSLALWLHLRRRSAFGGKAAAPEPPPGEGPLIVVHLSERADDPLPVAPLIRAILARRPESAGTADPDDHGGPVRPARSPSSGRSAAPH